MTLGGRYGKSRRGPQLFHLFCAVVRHHQLSDPEIRHVEALGCYGSCWRLFAKRSLSKPLSRLANIKIDFFLGWGSHLVPY